MTQPNNHIDDGYAIKTWRYLRLAMVLIVVGLAVAVVYEIARTSCSKYSISAYYYTPARGFFVGALIGIAVCLVCLRGSTAAEDVLLNIAGALAPVVALVPTPLKTEACKSLEGATEDGAANIANNVHALLAVGAAALLFALFMATRRRTTGATWIAWGAGVGACVAVLVLLECAPRYFEKHAHGAAALPMFLCITAVVAINALLYRQDTSGTLRNRYTVIAVGMGIAIAAWFVGWALAWEDRTFFTETALLVLFGIFWANQTFHLRHRGLWVERPGEAPGPERPNAKSS
jgi:hypothetical protein